MAGNFTSHFSFENFFGKHFTFSQVRSIIVLGQNRPKQKTKEGRDNRKITFSHERRDSGMKNFFKKNPVIKVVIVEFLMYLCVVPLAAAIFADYSLVAGISMVCTYTVYDMCYKRPLQTENSKPDSKE